jgi:hypothetical protein
MSCFITPAAAAILTTVSKKKIPAKYHLEWLSTMLWGGTVMLITEHVATGEKLFSADMLKEMATTGIAITLAVILVWAAMVLLANKTKNSWISF